MTENKLRQLVETAVNLDRQAAVIDEQLKGLKLELVQEAESRPEECVKLESGGSSWVATGAEGNIARVTFPGPSLKSTIDPTTPAGAAITLSFGKHIGLCFTTKAVYQPVADFREKVLSLFGGVVARKLLKACQSKSSVRVAFETKEKAA